MALLAEIKHARTAIALEAPWLTRTAALTDANAAIFDAANNFSGCLPGITRGVVIELAARHGISCGQRDLTSADLRAADEVFVTSSIRGLTGVSRFETKMLPPGPITRILREAWDAAVR